MSTTEKTVAEMTESLTGFDEIAISQHFNAEWHELAEKKPTILLRALVFIDKHRDGEGHSEAKSKALSLTMRDLNDYFAPEPDDVMPDEPDSPVGKDDSPLASAPTTSPPSAS